MYFAVLCCASGHVAVEKYLESEGLPFTVFQPLYIYGAHTAKDCEQWFIDRIIRSASRHTGTVAQVQSTLHCSSRSAKAVLYAVSGTQLACCQQGARAMPQALPVARTRAAQLAVLSLWEPAGMLATRLPAGNYRAAMRMC
jgi:hypothetical protein